MTLPDSPLHHHQQQHRVDDDDECRHRWDINDNTMPIVSTLAKSGLRRNNIYSIDSLYTNSCPFKFCQQKWKFSTVNCLK